MELLRILVGWGLVIPCVYKGCVNYTSMNLIHLTLKEEKDGLTHPAPATEHAGHSTITLCKVELSPECFTGRKQSRHAAREPVQQSLHGRQLGGVQAHQRLARRRAQRGPGGRGVSGHSLRDLRGRQVVHTHKPDTHALRCGKPGARPALQTRRWPEGWLWRVLPTHCV